MRGGDCQVVAADAQAETVSGSSETAAPPETQERPSDGHGEASVSLFKLWAQGVDVSAITAQLDANPELWGQNGYRTQSEDSPHHGVPDIWLRWRAAEELTSPAAFLEPHVPTFWPAMQMIPALRPVLFNVARMVEATQIGGVLITRTPARGRVKPHVDGGWHATFYNTKLYLVLRSNPYCLNHCGDEAFNTRAGDLLEYPNSLVHSVINDGDTDHVNVIMCLRTEGLQPCRSV